MLSVNLSSMNLSSVDNCGTSTFLWLEHPNHLDFIETMVVMTLTPIGFVMTLLISMWVEYEVKKYVAFRQQVMMDRGLLFRILKDKYLNY